MQKMSPRYIKKTKKPSKAISWSNLNRNMQNGKLQKDNKNNAGEIVDDWSIKNRLSDSSARTSTQNHEKCDSSVEHATKSLVKLNIYEEKETALTEIKVGVCRDVGDISMLSGMINFMNHSYQCPPDFIEMTENRYGLETTIKLYCKTCKTAFEVKPQPTANGKMSINEATVKGALGIGMNCSKMNKMLSIMEIPSFPQVLFDYYFKSYYYIYKKYEGNVE